MRSGKTLFVAREILTTVTVQTINAIKYITICQYWQYIKQYLNFWQFSLVCSWQNYIQFPNSATHCAEIVFTVSRYFFGGNDTTITRKAFKKLIKHLLWASSVKWLIKGFLKILSVFVPFSNCPVSRVCWRKSSEVEHVAFVPLWMASTKKKERKMYLCYCVGRSQLCRESPICPYSILRAASQWL